MVAAAGLTWIGAAPPASAAACSGSTGVTVVVDRGALGGGIDQVCLASGGGGTASDLFADAGHPLTYVQRQPGFVCRVDGAPASDPCVNTPPSTAYWGLFNSDGTSGTWSYSSLGVQSLTVPDGGYVALAWQTGDTRTPGVPATAHSAPASSASTPSPTTAAPTRTPTRRPSPTRTPSPTRAASPTPASTPRATPTASAEPSPSASASTSATPAAPTTTAGSAATFVQTSPSASVALTGSATPEASASTSPVAAPVEPPADDGSGGALPGWTVPVVLLVLLAAGVGVYADRRRRGSPRP